MNKLTVSMQTPATSLARLFALGFLLVLSACASKPFEVQGMLDERTPDQVVAAEAASAESDGTVMWGGVLVGSTNLEAETQFEVLGYPLDGQQRPLRGKKPQGRFLIVVDGYVETLDYADGREVSVTGTLEGVRSGKVGEATRRFPVVRADQYHLWPLKSGSESPRFSFGLGVGIGN